MANRSCGPQSQRSDPSASPVRQPECRRGRTRRPSPMSPRAKSRQMSPDAHRKARRSNSPAQVGRERRATCWGVDMAAPLTAIMTRTCLGTTLRWHATPTTSDHGGRSTVAARSRPVLARAVHFVAPRRVEVRDVDLPAPAEGQVLVATEWSGISSGTELLAYRGEIDPDLPLDDTLGTLAGTFAYPFRYGYSAVGRVLHPAGSRA